MTFTALAAGVSGLQAFGEGVGVIADNITNVNTIGYKETRSRFSTLVTETSSRSSYSPGGVRAFADTLVSKQGLLQPSTSATDLAVDGAGFFVVKKADDASADGEINYTRAGAFSQDADGFYQNTAGLFLMGWELDSAGNPPDNSQDLGELSPINITQLNGTAEATSELGMRLNLEASTALAGTYTTAGEFADGSVTPDFETNIQIFDSLGREHTVVLAASKTDTNEWSFEYYMDDESPLDSTSHPDGLLGYGTIAFNGDGSLDESSISFSDGSGTAIDLTTSPPGTMPIVYDATGETVAEAGAITVDFGSDGGTDGWTQNESSSVLISSNVDGAAFESVNGIAIDEDGIVHALFDNGLSRAVYQLPIAVFDNPNGLQRLQGNAYGASDNSGTVVIKPAGTAGAGAVAPNSLENSTVDLANEFAELIKVQRAFSASTRIITTADEVLEELTRL
jgi:flagellar hook protein FlgE